MKRITILASIIAVTLMITCCFSSVVSSSAADGGSAGSADCSNDAFKYVSLGDSMTAGYGLFGYYNETTNYNGFLIEAPGTYPALLTEYLEEQMPGRDVEHVQLAVSGSRTTELRALLDSSFIGSDLLPGDLYTAYYWGMSMKAASDKAMDILGVPAASKFVDNYGLGFFAIQDVYKQELADADLITINYNLDFPYGFTLSSERDFSLYTGRIIADLVADLKDAVEGEIISIAESEGYTDASSMAPAVEYVVSVVAYSVLGYCENMDAICGWIYSHNPDAKIVVIEPYNIFGGMKISVTEDFVVDAGAIYQKALDLANGYMRNVSPYSILNYYVSMDQVPETMEEEFENYAVGGTVSDSAKAAIACSLGFAGTPAQKESVVIYSKRRKFIRLEPPSSST